MRDWSRTSVQCYSGYRADESPRHFVLDGNELRVRRVLAEWREPESRHFTIRADDGKDYLLRQEMGSDSWQVKPMSKDD